jgi:DNA-binding NarL/FixJ family response regulator
MTGQTQFRTRVLIVEDDAFTRALTGEALAAAGMVVKTAESFAIATEILNDFEPNVVVSDLDLGGGPTGVDLLNRVHEERPWVGLVALTSHAAPTLAMGTGSGLPEGVVYLVKARMSSITDVQTAIEAAISHAQVRPPMGRVEDGSLIELSPAQAEILHLMAEGYSNAGIAEKRGTSMRAAESLVQRTMQALGIEADAALNSRVRAVRMWQQGRIVVRGN